MTKNEGKPQGILFRVLYTYAGPDFVDFSWSWRVDAGDSAEAVLFWKKCFDFDNRDDLIFILCRSEDFFK
jgi:hypothetical protein